MAEKTLKTRIIQKHDTEANWNKATNFIPKLGEVIIYDPDTTHTTSRIKVGDGTTVVASLPWATNDLDSELSSTSTNAVQNKVVKEAIDNKQDKFANITNPGICKVTMANSDETYFCNYASTSGIYFDTSIRLLQGHDITNDDDLVHKKYVDTEITKALATFSIEEVEDDLTITTEDIEALDELPTVVEGL